MHGPANLPGSDTQDFNGPGWATLYTGEMPERLASATPALPDARPPSAMQGVYASDRTATPNRPSGSRGSQLAPDIPSPNQLLADAARAGETLNFSDLSGWGA
jgi:hypothetical protein